MKQMYIALSARPAHTVPRLLKRAAAALLMCVFASRAQAQFTLQSITVVQDTLAVREVKVALTFTAPPISFPVYAMTAPERIVIDLPDTKAQESVRSMAPDVDFIKNIEVAKKIIGNTPNTRVEIFLKQDVRYTAVLAGRQLLLTLRQADKIRESVSVFSARTTSPSMCSMDGIQVRSMEKSLEIDISFTTLPQAASIYLLESPPRIVMDFNNVFVDKDFKKDVNVAPIENIMVIKREGQLSYAGVVVNLQKKVPFHYEQVENRIVVNIPWEGRKLSTRGKFMLIGTGVLVAGGFVTGIILSGDEEGGGGETPAGNDLGAPPQFPDF